MAAQQFAIPYRPVWDSNGKIIPGAQLYFTLSGTNTPVTVYADAGLTQPLANPVVANQAGRFVTVYYQNSPAPRVRLYDADDVAGVDAPLEDYNPYLGLSTGTNGTNGTNGVNGGVGSSAGYGSLKSAAAGMAVGVGITRVKMSGYSADGRGGADYVYDAAVDAAFVTAYPRAAFLAADGRGFRIDHSRGIDVLQFGAVGDNVADDSPAFSAAIAYLKSRALGGFSYGIGSSTLHVPAGRYYLGTTTLDITHTLMIEGESVGDAGGAATVLRWAANTTGIRVQAFNTSGASTVDGVTHDQGSATILSRLFLKGAYTNFASEGEYHGIHLKVRAVIRDCFVADFQGDGIHIWASAGAGAPMEGNANNFAIYDSWVSGCRDGLSVKGADANAGRIVGLNANFNRAWGVYDVSFLGNSYFGLHAADNGISEFTGTAPATLVSLSGNRYYVKSGQAVGASTNSPTGTQADNTWWGFAYVGGVVANVIPAWTSGIAVREGGSYRATSSWFYGCYEEGGQGPCIVDSPGRVVDGIMTNKGSGDWNRDFQGWARFSSGANRGIIADGSSAFNLNGAPLEINGDTFNFNGVASPFMSWNIGGVATAQMFALPGAFYINHTTSINLRIAGVDIANVSSDGLNFQAGKTLNFASLTNAVDDTAAAASVAIGGVYRNGSQLMVRVT